MLLFCLTVCLDGIPDVLPHGAQLLIDDDVLQGSVEAVQCSGGPCPRRAKYAGNQYCKPHPPHCCLRFQGCCCNSGHLVQLKNSGESNVCLLMCSSVAYAISCCHGCQWCLKHSKLLVIVVSPQTCNSKLQLSHWQETVLHKHDLSSVSHRAQCVHVAVHL